MIELRMFSYNFAYTIMRERYCMCTIKIFREGGSSKRCLKWGSGGWGSLRDLSKNILKQGVGKGKSCS